MFFCSILLRLLCCCSGSLASFPFWPFAARRSSSSMKQPGSTLVLRWVLKKLRSTYLRSTRPTRTTPPSPPASHPPPALHAPGRDLHAPERGTHALARVPHAPGSSLLLQPLPLDCPTLRPFLHLHHSDDRLFGLLLFFRLYLCFCVFMYLSVVFCWFYFSVLFGL
jgi:hypothetical protein